MGNINRVYVEKNDGFKQKSNSLKKDLINQLKLTSLSEVRIFIRYDVENLDNQIFEDSLNTVFSEPPVDIVYRELPENSSGFTLAVEYLPGQYDQRADSAAQCLQMITHQKAPDIKAAEIYIFTGIFTLTEIQKMTTYIINPVDSRQASLSLPETLHQNEPQPPDVKILKGFTGHSMDELKDLHKTMGLAMSPEDLDFCRKYFKEKENRNPTVTEIKVLDTYWSDHCRHTTFLTEITNVTIENSRYTEEIIKTWQTYLKIKKELGREEKTTCLMDLALAGMRLLKNKGLLEDQEETSEINACSIVVPAIIDGKEEEWLVMFKNETHNHPTEIEPFGGAATCLGGAIRDPLSGRSYVYQAMRVTGAADPRTPWEDKLPGKLHQKKITRESANGFSSYGNQIGLATGMVHEFYHPGYKAKRMEVGAVIAAAPRKNVVRGEARPGDIIVLTGGRTGRDGCGGATGSSKEHTEESILTSSAEVQKGNPPTERKLQRLFRNPEASRLIQVCNDFGAGGISVAIGELADGLIIDLDKVPKKYNGLDGTEISISESQERMAVVIRPPDAEKFIALAAAENLEAVAVAEVTEEKRVIFKWRGKKIVDLERSFIDTNGITLNTDIHIKAPDSHPSFMNKTYVDPTKENSISQNWKNMLRDLNICNQQGLVEQFDSTIGAASVLHPYGGEFKKSPSQIMAATLPVLEGVCETATMMSFGFNPEMSAWSPYHGAMHAVVESASKLVSSGAELKKIRLSFQEYFEKPGGNPERWGKPLSALLGAFLAQKELRIAAIGGKDSMSGSYEELDVPPTLVSFAVSHTPAERIISSDIKKAGNVIIHLPVPHDKNLSIDFKSLRKLYKKINKMISQSMIHSSLTLGEGGIAAGLSKMCFGNRIGVAILDNHSEEYLFRSAPGDILLEIDHKYSNTLIQVYKGTLVGLTIEEQVIQVKETQLKIRDLQNEWEEEFSSIFPRKAPDEETLEEIPFFTEKNIHKRESRTARPKVIIPVFPGTNCEYDSMRSFNKAGANAETFIIRNQTPHDINESLKELAGKIKSSQILMFPGGFSAGDEPDGSGKFIASVIRNPEITNAIYTLLEKNNGLILGICNGFQALIKTGLLPDGKISTLTESSPTLARNTIGRHISCYVETETCSVLSPWTAALKPGDRHIIPLSHGEGRFVANDTMIQSLINNGQVAFRYSEKNPNGSTFGIEGISSPDGRILGKMGHSERVGKNTGINISGNKDQKIFESGVAYFQ